jgi:hypothetical protein
MCPLIQPSCNGSLQDYGLSLWNIDIGSRKPLFVEILSERSLGMADFAPA